MPGCGSVRWPARSGAVTLLAVSRTQAGASPGVRVGRVVIPLSTARSWIQVYTDAGRNRTSDRPYAYPAYDCYDGGTREPARLTDGDLLAPLLLNVPVKIKSFYALQRIRPQLEDALRLPVLGQPLADIEDTLDLEAAVRAMYGLLETTIPGTGVKATTLSKVLHRKRPDSMVLHDRWVRACYVGDKAPVPLDRHRTWADYMVQVTAAIQHDVATQREEFADLRECVQGPQPLSDIRLLDILAWTSQGNMPIETAASLP